MKNVLLFALFVTFSLVVSGCQNKKVDDPFNDLDGDGWTNSAEDECGGYNPLDPTDVPSDTDGDGICNTVDTDDDGDGYSDQEEALCGSDPQDHTSLPVDLDNDGYCSAVDVDDSDPEEGLGDPEDQDPVIYDPVGIPNFPNPIPFPGGGPIGNGGETGLEFDNLPEAPIPSGETGLEFDNLPQLPIPGGNAPILPGAAPVGPGGENGLDFD